jgi:arsenite methyltransferase
VISNCLINLSVDKPKVITEMFRVLSLGGRIGISDVVAEDHLSVQARAERGSCVGRITGACLGRSTSTVSLPPASATRPSVSLTRSRMACTAPSSKRPAPEYVGLIDNS